MSDREEDFASMFAEFEGRASRDPQVGDQVEGKVISVGANAVFIDLGGKSEGVLDLDQVTNRDGEVTVKEGDTVSARVVAVDDGTGTIVLRKSMSRGADAVAELESAFEHGLPVEGRVTEEVKGGVSVDVAGVRGFCPVSQLDNRFVESIEPFVGTRMTFKITKLEGGRRPNLVLSRRVLLEAEAAVLAEQTRLSLAVGATMTGTVSSVQGYGAFVDLGGLEGMIHISEFTHSRIEHPEEVVAVGQQVEVKVLRIEPPSGKKNQEKIALSMKALSDNPWSITVDQFKVGSKVTGTVIRLAQFGAFVELAPGVDGLVHISELGAKRRIRHPSDVVKVGQSVEVTILSIELGKQRIALSMEDRSEEDFDIAAEMPASQAPPKSLGTFADLLKAATKSG